MKGLFIGFNTIDSQFLINKFPGQNEKIKANQFGLYTGGPATNAAITFSHLGGDTSLISSIGQHTFTEFILTELEEYRVKVIDLIPKKNVNLYFHQSSQLKELVIEQFFHISLMIGKIVKYL